MERCRQVQGHTGCWLAVRWEACQCRNCSLPRVGLWCVWHRLRAHLSMDTSAWVGRHTSDHSLTLISFCASLQQLKLTITMDYLTHWNTLSSWAVRNTLIRYGNLDCSVIIFSSQYMSIEYKRAHTYIYTWTYIHMNRVFLISWLTGV